MKKCGVDAVKAVMPEEHMRLLTNIRKVCQIKMCFFRMQFDMASVLTYICHSILLPQMKERKERKNAVNTEETRSHFSKATTSRFEFFSLGFWNMHIEILCKLYICVFICL